MTNYLGFSSENPEIPKPEPPRVRNVPFPLPKSSEVRINNLKYRIDSKDGLQIAVAEITFERRRPFSETDEIRVAFSQEIERTATIQEVEKGLIAKAKGFLQSAIDSIE